MIFMANKNTKKLYTYYVHLQIYIYILYKFSKLT